MEKVLVVALGGAAGCVCRYLLATSLGGSSAFPWGTLLVNVVGSGLLGVVMQTVASTNLIDPLLRLALTTGFMGGFTTYSTFNYETLKYLEAGEWASALGYVLATSLGCLLSGFGGILLVRWWVP